MNGATHQHRGLGLPDYRLTDIAEKHIRRGLCLVIRHLPVFLLLGIAGSMSLFLEERVRSGELLRLWSVAVQTDLTFNLVSVFVAVCSWGTGSAVTPLALARQQQQQQQCHPNPTPPALVLCCR
jgi:hypothetical protein